MKLIPRKYFIILVLELAILVGVLYAAPQFLIKKNVEEAGEPFVLKQFIELNDEGYFYLQNAREVYDGHFPPKDFSFSPGEQRPSIFNPLPPLIFSSFIFLTGDVNTAYLAASFVLPIILFLLFYLLGQIIFDKNRLWSLFFGLVAMFTALALHVPRAFLSIDNFLNIFAKNFYPAVRTFLPNLFYSRIDYPLVTDLIYLPAIILFFLFWQKPRLLTAIAAGIFTGLLFYTYFHYWVYWLVVIGVLFLYTLIFLRQDVLRLKNFVILLGTTILVSIPYFVNYFQFNNFGASREVILKIGLEIGRSFRWEYWGHYLAYLVLALLIYFVFWKRQNNNKAVLFWSFLVAAFVVWNIQFIVGFVPHSDHWPRAISPAVLIIIFSLVYYFVGKIEFKWPLFKKFTAGMLIFLSLLLVVKKIVNASEFVNPSREVLESYTLPKDYTDSWRWLEENVTGEPKIISSSFLTSIYLTAFTSARPFLPWNNIAPLSNFEIEELYLRANKVFGVSENVLASRLAGGQNIPCLVDCSLPYNASNIRDDHVNLYGRYFKDQGLATIPDVKISELIERYRALEVDWQTIGAEYVYYGPWEKHFSTIRLFDDNNLELIYRNSSVEIYKIKK